MTTISVVEVEGRGRCVIAERSYKPGDLILSEEPYAMIIAESYAEIACSYCCVLCANGTMYALSSGSSVRYCSEKCITADYPVHSYECQSIAALEEAQVQGSGRDSIRLVFRAACCRKQEAASSSSKSVKPNNVTVPLSGRYPENGNIATILLMIQY